jgi:N-methylhydantoinase A
LPARSGLQNEFRKLEAVASKAFKAEHWTGRIHYQRSFDLRYRGQGYELNIPAEGDAISRFHEEHQRRYGYHHPHREIELVTIRLRARLCTQDSRRADTLVPAPRKPVRTGRVVPAETAKVFFEKLQTTPVFERSDLPQMRKIKGPAVITEYSATTLIPPTKKFSLDSQDNLIIQL